MSTHSSTSGTATTSASQASTLPPHEPQRLGPRQRRESKPPTSFLLVVKGRDETKSRLADSTTGFTLSKKPAGWDLVQTCKGSTGTKRSTLYVDRVKRIVGGKGFTDVSEAETVKCELVGDEWKIVSMTQSEQPESSATSKDI
jgi:hypothetical protein